MIISASRRTDIPAFYAEWFMNRIRAGYLFVKNPFNARQFTRVNLSPRNVEVIVFWTKNPIPMLKYLDELDQRGYRYYFQFTVTAYPPTLEPSVPSKEQILIAFKTLSKLIGPDRIIWRFDPIIVSDLTPEAFIIDNFHRIASELHGYTKRVVISFVDFYKTVKRNLDRVHKKTNIQFHDISDKPKQVRRIVEAIVEIAQGGMLEIVSCAEKLDLTGLGIEHGKCIDDQLIKRIFGITVPSLKDKYQREECQCVQSQDIGQYNTCAHDCVYCYANFNKTQAHRNRAMHDPESPFLVGRENMTNEEDLDKGQMDLFSSSIDKESGPGEERYDEKRR